MPTPQTAMVRRIAIVVSQSISVGGAVIAILAGASQMVVMGMFFGGLLPYLVTIQLIEPWLEKRKG